MDVSELMVMLRRVNKDVLALTLADRFVLSTTDSLDMTDVSALSAAEPVLVTADVSALTRALLTVESAVDVRVAMLSSALVPVLRFALSTVDSQGDHSCPRQSLFNAATRSTTRPPARWRPAPRP